MDEVEDVASLLTEGGVGGEDAFDEAAALFGVRAVARLATEDAMAHGALGGVVRRLDALGEKENLAGSMRTSKSVR